MAESPPRMTRVERATPDDAELLLQIQQRACVAAFAHIFPPDRYPFPADQIREGWERALADTGVQVYVALVEDEPVASVSVGRGRLRTLYVLPEHQGTGIGSELHDFALARLVELGWTEARLWTLADNHLARRFYERRGWSLSGTVRPVPFPPNPVDVEYRRDLLA